MTERRIAQRELAAVRVALLKKQGGACPLCRTALTPHTACVDHNHTTGAIRGALCRNCNQMEGKIYNLANRAKRFDNVFNWIGRLLKYWLVHRTNQTGLLHPLHRSEDEKRERRNKKARERRAALKAAQASN